MGGADAEYIRGLTVPPEIMQRSVATRGGSGFHNSIRFAGTRTASSSFITADTAKDFSKCKEWVPYDTVYVFNEEAYTKQNQHRNEYLQELSAEENIEKFSKTASPDMLYDLISSTLSYDENSHTITGTITAEKKEQLRSIVRNLDFSECDNADNLRYMIATIKYLDRVKSIHYDDLSDLLEKCSFRITELAKNREFSIIDAIEDAREEFETAPKFRKDAMLDFVNSEIKSSKEKGFFETGDSIKQQIINQNRESTVSIRNVLQNALVGNEIRRDEVEHVSQIERTEEKDDKGVNLDD